MPEAVRLLRGLPSFQLSLRLRAIRGNRMSGYTGPHTDVIVSHADLLG